MFLCASCHPSCWHWEFAPVSVSRGGCECCEEVVNCVDCKSHGYETHKHEHKEAADGT